MSAQRLKLRDVVESSTGTCNPTKTPAKTFLYVDVAAVDNVGKRIAGQRSIIGAEAPSRARKLIRTGDILVSTVRPNLNAVALVPDELDGQVASTGFCVLRATAKVIPEYLFFFVRSRAFVGGLSSLVAGAMYPAVSDAQVLDQQLPLPPIAEQRRIVDILSRAEGIVRLRREAQKKAAEIIPALFLDMFGDPATNPKGWHVATLGGLVAEFRYGTSQKSGPEGLPTLRIPNVVGDRLEPSDMKLVDVPQAERDRLRLRNGDLLFVRTNGNPDYVGRSAVFEGEIMRAAGFDGDNCIYASYLIRARLRTDVANPRFLQAFLSSAEGRRRLKERCRTSAGQYNINTEGLASVPLLLPPIHTQEAFERRCSEVLGFTGQQSAATAKAEATFDALLASTFSTASG